MDMIIRTSSYEFSLDGIQMFVINKYLMDKLNTIADTGKIVYITRKEVKSLYEYIANHSELFGSYMDVQRILYDKIYNMWLVMNTKEKMEIRWW